MHGREMCRSLLLSVCCTVLMVSTLVPARSQIMIQGQVEYEDPEPLRQVWKPARDITVEIEGDWFWRSDPQVQTDDRGRYYYVMDNPPSGWADYDGVDIEAYAKKPDWNRVKMDSLDFWAYNCGTPEVDNVRANAMVRLDLRIGLRWPGGNAIADWTSQVSPTAFELQQRALDHRRELERHGLGAFDTFSIIYPGFTPADVSWYNHFFGQAHLSPLDALRAVKHEYGHQIHDECSAVLAPMGLNMPSEHSISTETDRFLAYTEGWAEFLMDYSEHRADTFEPTNPDWINAGWSDHAHCEGEVSGLLWDLSDPQGVEEVRHRNAALPAEVPQTWPDRIADTDLQRVWRTMAEDAGMRPLNPWTIREFISNWFAGAGPDYHEIKAIAYNRGIALDGRPEWAPELDEPRVTRTGNTFTVAGTVTEQDAEDRPFVKVQLWYRADSGPFVLCQSQALGPTGWTGETHAYELRGNVSPGPPYRTQDDPSRVERIALVVVDDEMLYRGRRAHVPGPTGATTAERPAVVVDDWGPLPEPEAVVPEAVQARQRLYRDAEPTFRRIRDNLHAAETLLENRAGIAKRVLRQARGLYKTATLVGTLKVPADGKIPMPRRIKPTEDRLGIAPWEEPKELLEWQAAVIQGGGVLRPLSEDDKSIYRQALDLSRQQRQELATMAKEAEAIPRQLRDAVEAYPWDELECGALIRECVARDAGAVEDALGRVAADQDTLRRLDAQIQVLEALLKGPSEQQQPAQPATNEPPKQPETTEPPKQPETTEPPKQPETTEPPKQPEMAEPPKQPETTEPPKEPQTTEPARQPETAEPPKQPDTTEPPKQPETTPGGKVATTTAWRFEVIGADATDEYIEQYCQDQKDLTAKEGQELLVVLCRLTNLMQKPLTPILTERLCGQTALTDAAGTVYTPYDYDARQESNKTQSYAAEPVAAGASVDFAIVFLVPKGTGAQTLRFTILRYPDDVGAEGKSVEVSLGG
jgi:outer membrane biosynthesis protein TonB